MGRYSSAAVAGGREGKEGQINGDGRRCDLGGEHTARCRDVL